MGSLYVNFSFNSIMKLCLMRFFFLTKDRGIFDRYPCFSDLQINPYNIVEYCGLAYLNGWISNVNYCFPGTLNNSFFTVLKYFQLLLVSFVRYYF